MGCGLSKRYGGAMDEHPSPGSEPGSPAGARQRAPRASLITSYTKVEVCKSPSRAADAGQGGAAALVPAAGPAAVLRYAYVTQRGYYPDQPDKANQDAVCVAERLAGDASTHLLGVLDGHGEFGAECAEYARDRIADSLAGEGPASLAADGSGALHRAMLAANDALRASPIDDSLSGTTACVAIVRGCDLLIANVGDSRAVLAERAAPGAPPRARDLSVDQTPFRAEEAARVRAAGARVLTLDQLEGLKDPAVACWTNEDDCDGDPPRLWSPHGMYPGTAFTRSIGDSAAEDIGVVADPELTAVRLDARAAFLIVATDGVWEFVGSQAAVGLVAACRTPAEGARLLVAAAYKAWLQRETRTDDITAVVAFFEGFDPEYRVRGGAGDAGQRPEAKAAALSAALPGLTSARASFKFVANAAASATC